MDHLKSALAWTFGRAIRLRELLYQKGIFETRRLPHPVISVGNLTVGGTGKTPLVAFLALMLKEAGYAPVVLSRGYRRKSGSGNLLVSDGDQVLSSPERCGDEPYLLARKLPGVVVAVGRNRLKVGQFVKERPGKQIYILDDGFQHRELYRDLDLLLIDGTQPFDRQVLLPAGRLREPLSSIRRADAVIITREHLTPDLPDLARQVRRWNPAIPIFPFAHEMDKVYYLDSQARIHPTEYREKKVLALAAIGNPAQFLKDLEIAGFQVAGTALFRDHHRFSQKDLNRTLEHCRELAAEALITTEKDAVRLRGLRFDTYPIFVVSIRSRTANPAGFLNWLKQRLEAKQARQ